MTSLINKNAAGIIPADAGSTLFQIHCICKHGDHPRGCGEHSPFEKFVHPFPGSSPRMRGAHHLGAQPGLVHRIIPADAGSTLGHTAGITV